MNLFSKYFIKILSEDNVAGAGGVFGDVGGGTMFPGGGDIYAPGDARLPHLLGDRPKKKKKTKKSKRNKRKKNKRKKKVKREQINVLRRTLRNSL